VGPRAVLETVVKGKIPSPRRESNPGTAIKIFYQRLAKHRVNFTFTFNPCKALMVFIITPMTVIPATSLVNKDDLEMA
jgi:hypothetical protein